MFASRFLFEHMSGMENVFHYRAFCSLSVNKLSEYNRFQEAVAVENGVVVSGKKLKREGEVVVDHCNIIERGFWEEHPHILSYS